MSQNDGFPISTMGVNQNQQPITNLPDPVDAQDAATKNYVDTSIAAGIAATIDHTKYTCQLFQTATNPPYDNVLGNRTLSNGGLIAWTRTGVGVYNGSYEGAFPQWKTAFKYSGFTPDGKFIKVSWVDADNISVVQLDERFAAVDGIALPFDLEIQVYSINQLND